MKSKIMLGWEGPWRYWREFWRGMFHRFVGVTGFWVAMISQMSAWEITKLFALVAAVVLLMEYMRLRLDCWREALQPTDVEKYENFLDRLSHSEIPKLASHISKRTLDWLLCLAQYLNNTVAPKILSRPSERNSCTAMARSALGFMVVWLFTWQDDLHWIAGVTCLYFGFVDTSAKWGYHYGIKEVGWRNTGSKSWGGFFYGWSTGVLCALLVFDAHVYITPLLPPDLTDVHFMVVALFGATAASIGELFGGKWDNFFIPASSALAMVLVHLILCIF